MAAIRQRKGKRGTTYIVDYRDTTGKRRTPHFKSPEAARRFAASRNLDPGGDPNVTIDQLARRWLSVAKVTIKRQSLRTYFNDVRKHILPKLGRLKISKLSRAVVKDFLASKLASGLSSKTVSHLMCSLNGICRTAIEDGVITANPCLGVWRQLRLGRVSREPGSVKAMTEGQLFTFLETAKQTDPEMFPFFFLMARTGVRVSEACAIEWRDVDLEHSRILISKSFDGPRLDTTKGGFERWVDMSQGLRAELLELQRRRKENQLRQGWIKPWLFTQESGAHYQRQLVGRKFRLIAEAAELPSHFSCHSLRHTFACLHLLAGTSPVYVQRQLGHRSIQMTVDLYGRWFQPSDLEAANRLDKTSFQR